METVPASNEQRPVLTLERAKELGLGPAHPEYPAPEPSPAVPRLSCEPVHRGVQEFVVALVTSPEGVK